MAIKLKELTERSSTEIVPTPGNDKGVNVSYKNVVQKGEKAFVDKHVVAKTDYPVPEKNAGDKNAIFTGSKQTKAKRIADQDNEEGCDVYESLSKNKSDFVSRFGKVESDVDAVDEEIQEESDEENLFVLDDGSEFQFTIEEMSQMEDVFNSLTEDHQDQFEDLFVQSRETNEALMGWVRSVA
jgi:hypothetical protein